MDDILPDYDVNEVHGVRIKASAQVVFSCIKEITPSEISWVMRFLVWLRTLPEKLVGRRETWINREEPLLSQMSAGNFTLLSESAPREIVLGMLIPGKIGRFWQKSSQLNVQGSSARDYFDFNQPGYIRVVMNLLVETTDPDHVSVRTETRCRATSREALTDFTPYWRLIRPFSGLIRIVWLGGIKRKAERQMLRREDGVRSL